MMDMSFMLEITLLMEITIMIEIFSCWQWPLYWNYH
jgi:hypothetical protein